MLHTKQTMCSPKICRLAALLFAAASLSATTGCQMAATGQNLQGKRLYEQGQHTAALQQFQQAVTSDPQNADAFYNMGRTYHAMGNQSRNQESLAKAEKFYNQCLESDTNHRECRRSLAVLQVENGRSDLAFSQLKSWAAANPQSAIGAEAHVELARLYTEFGDRETARLYLDQALHNDLQNSRAWKSLAWMQEADGKHDAALANYQRSYSLNAFQPGVAQRIATLQRNTGARIDATRSTGTRTVNNPNNPPLRY